MDWPQVSSIYDMHCDKENIVPSYIGIKKDKFKSIHQTTSMIDARIFIILYIYFIISWSNMVCF